MKILLLIFSCLLSFLSEGRTEAQSIVSESRFTEEAANDSQNRELCFGPAQGYAFAGSNSTNSVSVRTAQSFRRLNQPVRSNSRIIKGGKVIDNNHLHPFLAQSFVHLAGIHIPEKFLFSICRLRL